MLAILALVVGVVAWSWWSEEVDPVGSRRLEVHQNVLAAWSNGEFVRTTEVVNLGSLRGQAQTQEVERREHSRANGVLSRPDGLPPYVWLVGQRPGFDLDVLHPQDRDLLLRLANGTHGPQRVTVHVNGRALTTHGLPPGESSTDIVVRVPADLQRRGRNRVELLFELTEMRQLFGEPVALPLAGILTTVRFAPPARLDDPPPSPPEAVGTIADGERSVLVVPPATSARVAIDVPDAERVVLRMRLREVGAPCELSVLDDEGRRTRLRTFQPGDAMPSEFRADLTPWRDRPVVLDVWARAGAGRPVVLTEAAVLVPPGQPLGLPPSRKNLSPVANPPSYLIVTLDALARRRLPALGHDPAAAEIVPNLHALAGRGISFGRATAPASYTLASIGSLLTGQNPLSHGVGLVEDGRGVMRLRDDTPKLAAILRDRGWRTAAWVTNPNAAARHGYGEGFERYEELFRDAELWDEGVSGEHLPPRLAGFLDEVGEQPFLAWVHVFEPHAPYDAPADLQQRFVDPYEGGVEGSRAWLDRYRSTELAVDAEGWNHLGQLYRARVAEADRVLGELLDVLEQSGRADDTVVLVTSDHGEAFGEHGAAEHGDLVYGEQVEIPFVLAVPGGQGARWMRPATLEDAAPTLLAIAGLSAPAAMDGIDLITPFADERRPLVARSSARLPVLSWTRGTMRLVVDTMTRQRELYDLGRDPGEARDLIEERPATAALLFQELCAAVCEAEGRGPAIAAPDGMSPELRAHLQAIGYAAPELVPHSDTGSENLCHLLRARLRRL